MDEAHFSMLNTRMIRFGSLRGRTKLTAYLFFAAASLSSFIPNHVTQQIVNWSFVVCAVTIYTCALQFSRKSRETQSEINTNLFKAIDKYPTHARVRSRPTTNT